MGSRNRDLKEFSAEMRHWDGRWKDVYNLLHISGFSEDPAMVQLQGLTGQLARDFGSAKSITGFP